ncbi:MAG: PTS system mannose/fructose/N-acetylgalactosamine-transporter subunit IIB [bacterium]
MAIVMVRIDDRLIHGQVLVGWCPNINPDHLILCNDQVAQSEWECEIYKDAASEYKTSICTVAETAKILKREESDDEKIFLIVDSPKVIVRLIQLGLNFDKVVIGGMHYYPGKRKITNFIFIDDEDLQDFKMLARHNIILEGKDVPNSKPIDVASILELKKM